jgi:hypothetical protein
MDIRYSTFTAASAVLQAAISVRVLNTDTVVLGLGFI